MILKNFWSVDKELPNVHSDDTGKPLEGKKILMMNVAKRKKAAGTLHSFLTYVISAILAIFLLSLLLAVIFDMNVCVTCLASYPEIIKNKMNNEGHIISTYGPENSSNSDIMTTESAVANAEKTLAINLKEQLENLERDPAHMNLSKDTSSEKTTAYQNQESVTNIIKTILHNNSFNHDSVSDGEYKMKSFVNIPKHSSNDKKLSKELSEIFSDLGIMRASGIIQNIKTTLSEDLKEQSKDLETLEMDPLILLLFQAMLHSGMEQQNHEIIANTMMHNLPNEYQTHDKASETEIPKTKFLNAHKHSPNSDMIPDTHQIIHHTPFKHKTHFHQSAQNIENYYENSDIFIPKKIFSDVRDKMDTFTENYIKLDERNGKRKSPILYGKLQHDLPDLRNNSQNLPLTDIESKIIISIMSNPKKIEGSYETIPEQDFYENKSYIEKTESALNDSVIQSYFNTDVPSSDAFTRQKFTNYPLKLPALKKGSGLINERKEFPSKYFSGITNDRIVLPHSEAKFGDQIIKKRKQTEMNYNPALIPPSSTTFSIKSNNSFQTDGSAMDKSIDHKFNYLIVSKDPIKKQKIKNINHLNENNGRKMETKANNAEVSNFPVAKTLNSLPSISITENTYSGTNETSLKDSTKIHNFSDLLERDESTINKKDSRKSSPSKESYQEEYFETDELLPKSTKNSKIKLSKSQKRLFPIVSTEEKTLAFEKMNDNDDSYDSFERSIKDIINDDSSYPPIKLNIAESVDPETESPSKPFPRFGYIL